MRWVWLGAMVTVVLVAASLGRADGPASAEPPASLPPVSLLMVSNSPEKLRGFGLCYEAVLADGKSARLLYHHVNATSGPARLAVELWNLGQHPARVRLTAGLGGPSRDELGVGHQAAADYLRKVMRNAGTTVSLPPETIVTAFSQVMPRGSVASGVAELRPVGPAKISVRVLLGPTGPSPGPRPVGSYTPSPLLGRYQYPAPQRELKARYDVGGNWAFVAIGDQPAVGLKDGDRLQGSYGVVHEVTLELANPTREPAAALLALQSGGGPARGCLLVDGRQTETPVLREGDEAALAKYHLAPGETRVVSIAIMPEAGSNYPVRLVAHTW